MMKESLALWAFDVTAANEAKKSLRKGRYKGHFLGSRQEADDEARNLQAEMTMAAPGDQVTVTPELLDPAPDLQALAERLLEDSRAEFARMQMAQVPGNGPGLVGAEGQSKVLWSPT